MPNFKWLLEVEVDPRWVADGFDFTSDRLGQVSQDLLPDAYPGEVSVRIVCAPSQDLILEEQGYAERKRASSRERQSPV